MSLLFSIISGFVPVTSHSHFIPINPCDKKTCWCVYLYDRQHYLWSTGAQSHERQIGHSFIPDTNRRHWCFSIRHSDGHFLFLLAQRHKHTHRQGAVMAQEHLHILVIASLWGLRGSRLQLAQNVTEVKREWFRLHEAKHWKRNWFNWISYKDKDVINAALTGAMKYTPTETTAVFKMKFDLQCEHLQ